MGTSRMKNRLNPPASVYAIELHPAAAKKYADRSRAARGALVVYVGQSALAPGVRFEHHLAGGMHTNSAVQHHGKRVLWSEGPFSDRDIAEREERRVARLLRRAGAVVLGGH